MHREACISPKLPCGPTARALALSVMGVNPRLSPRPECCLALWAQRARGMWPHPSSSAPGRLTGQPVCGGGRSTDNSRVLGLAGASNTAPAPVPDCGVEARPRGGRRAFSLPPWSSLPGLGGPNLQPVRGLCLNPGIDFSHLPVTSVSRGVPVEKSPGHPGLQTPNAGCQSCGSRQDAKMQVLWAQHPGPPHRRPSTSQAPVGVCVPRSP